MKNLMRFIILLSLSLAGFTAHSSSKRVFYVKQVVENNEVSFYSCSALDSQSEDYEFCNLEIKEVDPRRIYRLSPLTDKGIIAASTILGSGSLYWIAKKVGKKFLVLSGIAIGGIFIFDTYKGEETNLSSSLDKSIGFFEKFVNGAKLIAIPIKEIFYAAKESLGIEEWSAQNINPIVKWQMSDVKQDMKSGLFSLSDSVEPYKMYVQNSEELEQLIKRIKNILE